jgi:glycosyltransferase involved in cell wall biosynthesis
MNILIISPYHWNSKMPSGIANSVRYLSLAFSKVYKVEILCSNVGIYNPVISDDSNLIYTFYKVIFSDKYLVSLDFFTIFLNRIKKYDIIVINEYFSIKILFILIVNRYYFHKKVVFFPRGSLIRHLTISTKKILFDNFFLNFYKKVDHVFFTSDYEIEHSPTFNNSTLLSNCFIPLDHSNFKKKMNDNYFLYVNEISKAKGFDFLISSWKMFYDNNPGYQLLIIGHINIDYTEDFNYHSTQFTDYNIIYLGVIKGREKDKYIFDSLLTLLTSFSENFSNIVIESLSYGVPVLATHGTPWHSLVQNNCGYYITHDSNLFCKSLTNFIKLNHEQRLRMKKNALNFFESNFSFNNFSKTLLSTINLKSDD